MTICQLAPLVTIRLQTRQRSAIGDLTDAITTGTLTADELLGRYCTLVFAQTGSYVETARRLQLDRRTVKSKIDPQFLEQPRSRT